MSNINYETLLGLTSMDIDTMYVNNANIITLTVSTENVSTSTIGTLNVTGDATIGSLTASMPVKTNALKKLVSGLINLVTEVTGTLPVSSGGSGSAVALVNDRMMISKSGTIVAQTGTADSIHMDSTVDCFNSTSGSLQLAGGAYVAKNILSGQVVGAQSVSLLASSNQILFIPGINFVHINCTTPASSRVYTIGDAGTNANFMLFSGTTDKIVKYGPYLRDDTVNDNVVCGSNIAPLFVAGTSNVLFGSGCAGNVVAIWNNVIVGAYCFGGATNGSDGVYIGYGVGSNISNGSRNVLIGSQANTSGNYSDCVGIGYLSVLTASNQLSVGNTNSKSLIQGSFSNNNISFCNQNLTPNYASGSGVMHLAPCSSAPAGVGTDGINIFCSGNDISFHNASGRIINLLDLGVTTNIIQSNSTVGQTINNALSLTGSVDLPSLSANTFTYLDASKILASGALSGNLTLTAGTLNTIQNIQTTSSPTFSRLTLSATTNQLVINSGSFTNTIHYPIPSANRVYTLPDCGGNANFIMSNFGSTQFISSGLSVTGTISSSTGFTSGVAVITAITAGSINLPSLTASLPLQLDASNNIISSTIPLSSGTSGTLSISRGGTNSTIGLSNGYLMCSKAGSIVEQTNAGDTNLLAGSLTVGTGLTVSGATTLSSLTASLPLKVNASKQIISQAIDLTTDVGSSILPYANGGAGISTSGQSNTSSGPWASPVSSDISSVLAGVIATLVYPSVSGSSSSSSVITLSTATVYKPAITQYGNCIVTSNSVDVMGSWSLTTAGVLKIYAGVPGTTFSSSGTTAVKSFTITYLTYAFI